MSRREREQQSLSPPIPQDENDLDEDSADDQLARELEEERQKILARVNDARDATTRSDESRTTSDQDGGYDYEETDDGGDTAAVDEDDSEDEWQPPEPAVKSTRRSKRDRQPSISEDRDGDAASIISEEEFGAVPKKSQKTLSTKAIKSNGSQSKPRAKTPRLEPPLAGNSDHDADEEVYDSFDEEAERVQAEVEAAAAWADVRRRKEAAQAQPATNGPSSNHSSSQKQPQASVPSLTAWLGKGPSASSSVSELASSLPMPSTCTAAQIVDRNSLFIGYVYPLITTSSAYISTLLSHLSRVVHPTVSVGLLPPQFANAPANKRGSSHDMYAHRVLELKRGRTGLAGPDDFSLQEGKEDDGERWGGDRVLKVAREEGASDVLVVVSRWYGGELLGPVRFDHIEKAAREALVKHVKREEVEELRQRIQWLDRKIARLKIKLAGDEGAGGAEEGEVAKYQGLTVEKGQRLWLARQKALDVLQKKVDQMASQELTEHRQEAAPEQRVASTEDALLDSAISPPRHVETQQVTEQETTVKPEPSAPSLTASPLVNPATPIKAQVIDPPLPIKQEHPAPSPEQTDDNPTIKPDPDNDLTGWDDLA